MLGAVPLLLIVWAVARRRELGSLAPPAWAALGFAVVMLLLSFGRVWLPVSVVIAWLPLLRQLPLPLPLPGAVSVGGRGPGGDRIHAADPPKQPRPTATQPETLVRSGAPLLAGLVA